MKFHYTTNLNEILTLIDWHNANSEYVVLDTETTELNPRRCKIVDVQMSGREPESVVMFPGEFAGALKALKPTHVGQNWIKYDWQALFHNGVDVRNENVRDTMLMHHLVDESASHSLDDWVQENYADDYKEKFWATYKSYQEAPLEARVEYACKDVVYTDRFYAWLRKSLSAQAIPGSLVEHVHSLARALVETEIHGIRVDVPYTVEMGAALKQDIERTQLELRRLAGYPAEIVELKMWAEEINKLYKPGPRSRKWQTVSKPLFNWGSGQQVRRLLYGELGLPVQIGEKTKNPTVDDKALETLGDAHPVLPELRKLRKYTKMHGAFIEGILGVVEADRIYPSFSVNGTVTGRISHSVPNMAQMPAKGEWCKIRGIFVPSPGHKLLTCDYGMLEVVVAAHFSQDKNLLRIIHEGASKHDITADALGISRTAAKTVNFACQYGAGARKLAAVLGVSNAEGQVAFDRYWASYSGERAVIDACRRSVDNGEPIRTPFGRLRHFPVNFSQKWEREAAYRQAYSALIQGTGADLTSRSFVLISRHLQRESWGRGLFTVHDEVVVEIEEDRVAETQTLLKDVMIAVGKEINLTVPLTVDCGEPLERWTK